MRLALSIVVLVMSAHGSLAQVTLGTPPSSASSFTEQTIKVTTTFRTPFTVPDGQAAADTQAQAAARRELYRLTDSECAALSEIYKAECHLTGVTIATYVPVLTNAPQSYSLSATAVYELRRNRTTP
jgi:hypothetical protein